MSTIEVISSITGDKDQLIEDQPQSEAKFIMYTDTPMESKRWEIRPSYDRFKDPRRNSRIHKILIHKYSEADYTIWIDGNMRLLMTPEELIEKYMKGYDMAIYAHRRDCIYGEASICVSLKMDDPEILIEQAKYYEDHDFPKNRGLCEGGFIIRKKNHRTQALNEAWWADYCRFSRRDQISLMPAIDKSGVVVNTLLYPWINHDGFSVRADGTVSIYSHAHFEGNFNDKK